ncbi:hypothetical protein [Pseudomonas aeruginosa]|uniref:hypothetical protein n=1 Tax=Pseudomonas aeruginosa TaxID=287 RepID=UPI002497A704|nr:hypothetical protein [Pseudomonas aeruginosa]MDI2345940.1 hypothetical protein [Pseudomonas aeruginosa]
MSIDWSTAPEGATHWEPRSYDFAEGWMRKDWDGWSYWSEGREVWVRGVLTCDVSAEREATFEARPQEPWNGQGLPPVGTVCRLSGPTRTLVPLHPEWAGCEVKIYAHFESDRGIKMAAYVSDDHMIGGCGVEDLFVRMPTPEQIAAEQREKAINQMISDAGYVDPKIGTFVAMRNLYDAGYRRQESST